MIITCDSSCNMGYIYLQSLNNTDIFENNRLSNYFDISKIQIPLLNGDNIIADLEKLKLMPKNYWDAYQDKEFEEEYRNDLDDDGYMVGIELNSRKESFLKLINLEVFKVYELSWHKTLHYFATFDSLNVVLDPGNFIYSFTSAKDAFVIIKKKQDENVALIKGLITCREDKYPVKYLSNPMFVLWENNF